MAALPTQHSNPLNVSLIYFVTGDDRPDLYDLYINIIPQHAAHWEALGAILGLKD